jgi:hypothetical protein
MPVETFGEVTRKVFSVLDSASSPYPDVASVTRRWALDCIGLGGFVCIDSTGYHTYYRDHCSTKLKFILRVSIWAPLPTPSPNTRLFIMTLLVNIELFVCFSQL